MNYLEWSDNAGFLSVLMERFGEIEASGTNGTRSSVYWFTGIEGLESETGW